uniref:Ring finger protein 103 n=1 Tax=Papio anubis TaxID=9555 RepID=A0A8I5NDK7_PAPAN
MWLKLFFLLLYFLVLFVLARFFEAIVWYETGIFASQLVDPVALSFKKLKTILECRGLGYSGLPEKKDVRELVEKSGDLMEGELYSALKEEEASESVSSTNFSGEMHFYELVEDTKDGIWLVQSTRSVFIDEDAQMPASSILFTFSSFSRSILQYSLCNVNRINFSFQGSNVCMTSLPMTHYDIHEEPSALFF